MPKGHGTGSKATQFKKLEIPLQERFDASYIPEPMSGCWLWLENVDNKNYGRITTKGKMSLAHRVSWMLQHGKLPELFVLHHCDNSFCVNPDHLYEGTQKQNVADCVRRNRKNAAKGENHAGTKLFEADVFAIRADNRAQSAIAKHYGISQSAVSLIKTKKNWGHI